MLLVSVEKMKELEEEANSKGFSYELMMENAGKSVAEKMLKIAHSQNYKINKILGLVGPGNKGGDTLIALSQLSHQKPTVKAYLIGRDIKGDKLIDGFIKSGGEIILAEEDRGFSNLSRQLKESEAIIDGILGTGLKLPLRNEIKEIMARVNAELENLTEKPTIFSVDCPSGVDCATGETSEAGIHADQTIAIAAVKEGLLKIPAFGYTGVLSQVEIGFNKKNSSIASVKDHVVIEEYIKENIKPRPADAHKGTFGTVLIIAGSLNYTGAALLAGKGAYRVGSGLVTMGVPSPIHSTLAGQFPEATWILLPHEMGGISEDAVHVIKDNFNKATSLLVGCGIGTEESTLEFMKKLIEDGTTWAKKKNRIGFVQSSENLESSPKENLPPMVIDADGLKLIAKIPGWHKLLPNLSILTPHPGEMEMLTGISKDEIQQDRRVTAVRFAEKWGHIVVLKGAFTVIASPEGQTMTLPIATPALAKAGSGDVLAGMIAGLRGQGYDPFLASVIGAWLHGQAGLIAAKNQGNTASIMASDLLESIPQILKLI